MGLNLAGFMAAFIIGPIIGGFVDQRLAAWIGVGGTVVAMLGLWLFVPESLTQAAKEKARLLHCNASLFSCRNCQQPVFEKLEGRGKGSFNSLFPFLLHYQRQAKLR